VPTAYHQPPTVLVELVRARRDVRGDLSLQRGGQHPPRPFRTISSISDPLTTGTAGVSSFVGDYREHGRTFPTRVPPRALVDP